MVEDEQEGNELFPPDSTADKVIQVSAIVSGALPIPWLAPTVSNVLTGISNQRKINRIRETLERLNKELKDVNSAASKNYVKRDEFEDLLEQTLRRVGDERNEQKRKMYGHFLAEAIKVPDESYDEQLRFVRDLEKLQGDHIRIFEAMLQSPAPNPGYLTGSTFRTLASRLSDIPERRLQDLTTQLEDMRLITRIDKTMVTPATAEDLQQRFSNYGRRFIRYLES